MGAAAVKVRTSPQPESEETVIESLRALLTGIIDYAGLFPPAQLDMPATVRNYADFLASNDAWMLGRLVIPASRLDEFERHAASVLPRHDDSGPWQISTLVSTAGDPQLEVDLQRIAAFNDAHRGPAGGWAEINVIELGAKSAADIEDALNRIPDDLFPFFELPINDDPRGLIAALAGSDAGAKVRTGGAQPQSSPKPEHLARFIWACAVPGVPFKATAGLHHPLSHRPDGPDTLEFGFLNVFVSGVLAAPKDLSQGDLLALLTDESLDSFTFAKAGLRYHDHELTTGRIQETRLKFATSFGSCSFDEPRADLRALNLL